jgi:prepilin-type N-terminal cleavage/methylation domain-containing protein
MRNTQAFSLVELSIVLVILGLLTGGILGGQSLIKAAELRSVTTEYNEWQVAINTFRGKYGQLPGDFTNATRFWGARTSCPAPDYSSSAPPSAVEDTCNGNGNGNIGDAIENAASEDHEQLLFWQHLSNAGLVRGQYNGQNMSGSAARRNHHVGYNCPMSKFDSSACWGYIFIPANGYFGYDHHGRYFPASAGNVFMLGVTGSSSSPPHMPNNPVMAPDDIWNIDTKVDNGQPDTGLVRTNESSSNCYEDVGGVNEYSLSNSGRACLILFLDHE